MVEEGWPAEQSIFDHAAYLLLRWQTENQDQITIQQAMFRKNFLMGEQKRQDKAGVFGGIKNSIGNNTKPQPKGYENYK